MKTQRLVALCLLGVVLLHAPLLALASRPATVAGLPLLFVYLFAVWGVLIGAAALIVEGRGRRKARRS